MTCRSPIFIVALMLSALLFVGCAYLGLNQRQATPQQNNGVHATEVPHSPSATEVPGAVTWNFQMGTIPQVERQALMAALAARVHTEPTPVAVRVLSAYVNGDWGIFYGAEQAASESGGVTTAKLVFLAHKTAVGWQITRPGDSDYCQVQESVPDSVMSPVGKRYFCAAP